MDYLEVTVHVSPRDPWSEIIVSQLSELGFDSFVDIDSGIQAYGPSNKIDWSTVLDESLLKNDHPDVSIEVEKKIIPHQNWNAIWEADFQPVFVEDKLSILAPFHDKSIAKGMIVEIQPQMSFGTGHHQTTWMMSKALLEMKQVPNRVLDMGTGTGVLAILAEKRGATDILAIDIEDWSVENTKENALRNGCTHIEALCGDVDLLEGLSFELILANINKNILKVQLPMYASCIEPKGKVFLSGFFETDVDELVTFAAPLGLTVVQVFKKETWAAIELEKSSQ